MAVNVLREKYGERWAFPVVYLTGRRSVSRMWSTSAVAHEFSETGFLVSSAILVDDSLTSGAVKNLRRGLQGLCGLFGILGFADSADSFLNLRLIRTVTAAFAGRCPHALLV